MKAKQILPLAFLALGLCAGCSNDNITTGDTDTATYDFTKGGYISFAIQLPTDNSSARAENDNFDDGLASEYQVNLEDSYILLFKGEANGTEADAKFYQIQKLSEWNPVSDGDHNQITVTSKVTQKVDDETPVENTGKLYALVILNGNGTVTFTEGKTNEATVAGEKVTSETTFSGIQSSTVSETEANGATVFAKTNFFMANAALSTVPGGSLTAAPSDVKVQTLVDVTTNVYDTEAEAEAAPAAVVNVERGAAKVTMHTASGKLSGKAYKNTSADAHEYEVSYKLVGWQLNATNSSSYVLHNADQTAAETNDWASLSSSLLDNANYRFMGYTTMESADMTGDATQSKLYRTYWGTDPNYDKDASGELKYVDNKTTLATTFGDENPLYCMENTFDVANQLKKNTTQVLLKVQLTPEGTKAGDDFYTIGDDKAKLYTTDQIKATVFSAITSDQIDALIAKYKAAHSDDKGNVTINLTDGKEVASGGTATEVTGFIVEVDKDKIELNVAEEETAGAVTELEAPLKWKYTTSNNTTGTEFTPLDIEEGNSKQAYTTITKDATFLGIDKYAGGYAYYTALIKHFGDDLTPWEDEKKTNGTGYGVSGQTGLEEDGTDTQDYLGRYGVLRNNWYDLQVSSIKGIGSATIPDVKGDATWDDELDTNNYISLKIRVMSWAKRTQDVKL